MRSLEVVVDDMVVYAVRYAINRGSYASGTMAETVTLLANEKKLTFKTGSVIARDIRKALEEDTIPYEDQRRDWHTALEAILAML